MISPKQRLKADGIQCRTVCILPVLSAEDSRAYPQAATMSFRWWPVNGLRGQILEDCISMYEWRCVESFTSPCTGCWQDYSRFIAEYDHSFAEVFCVWPGKSQVAVFSSQRKRDALWIYEVRGLMENRIFEPTQFSQALPRLHYQPDKVGNSPRASGPQGLWRCQVHCMSIGLW